MERNFRNYLIWEEPNDDRLDIVPRRDKFNQEEISALFQVELSNRLAQDRELLLLNAPVQITCESSVGNATVDLLIFGTPPYILRRDGEVIARRLYPKDFPYSDSRPNTSNQPQQICYEVEDDGGDAHEVCCTVQPPS